MTTAFEDSDLFTDHQYHCCAQLKSNYRNLPMTTVTIQHSWRDSLEARVRVAIANMLPEDMVIVEGVQVRRYTSISDHCGALLYSVAGTQTSQLAEAVKAVCAAVRRREGK